MVAEIRFVFCRMLFQNAKKRRSLLLTSRRLDCNLRRFLPTKTIKGVEWIVNAWRIGLAFWIAGMGNLTLPNDDGRGQTRAQFLILEKVLQP